MIALSRTLVLAAAGTLALAPLPLAAQARTPKPSPNAPRILIAPFGSRNTDARTGVESAEALRARVQRNMSPNEGWVIPREQINITLQQSGFPADMVLRLDDLEMLAQNLRADVIVDGIVERTNTGLALTTRLILPANTGLIQPLPNVEARNAGDAATQIARHFEEAQKSVADFRRCANALSAENYAEARAAAQRAIARYPSSTLGRLCLLDAYTREQQPLDSIINAAQAVLRIDSTSVLALTNLADAYREKHDTANAVAALGKLVIYRPDLRLDLVRMLVQMNQPKVALPIIRQLVAENPDPELLRTEWLILLADHQWSAARQAGEEYIRTDSSAANEDYFTRSIAAALADGQPVLAVDVAGRALSKFPKSAGLWALQAQAQRKAGKLPEGVRSMRQALVLDPKTESGWTFLVVAQIEAGQLDSAMASARQAIAAGADRAALAQAFAAPLASMANRANTEKTRDRWLDVYRLGSAVDSIVPSPDAKFFVGLGAFQVGLDALKNINANKSCNEAKLAEDMWTTASIAMPAAAQAGPQQKEAAGQIMSAIQQYSPAIAQAKKAYCKAR